MRGTTFIALVGLALGVMKGLNGCGSTSGGAADDGAAGDKLAVVTNCDPAKQTGCATDEKCDLFCSGGRAQFSCRKDQGTLVVGATCKPSAASGVDACPKGTICFASARGTTCTSLCDSTVACGVGSCTTVQALIGCAADPAMNKPFSVSVCQ